MRINESLNPALGLFSAMPQDIWGPEFDPSNLDIELFTRIGELDQSPLMRYYVTDGTLDTEGLATLLFQKYGKNWQRMWDALILDYDLMITSTNDEKRNTERITENLETRDLTDLGSEDRKLVNVNNSANVRSGSKDHTDDSTLTRNLTDEETRDTTNTTTASGNDTNTETYNETNAVNSKLAKTGSEKTAGVGSHSNTVNLTKTGSENRTGSDNAVKNLTDTESGTVKDKGKSSDTGTVNHDKHGTDTGTGSHDTSHGVYGVGGAGLTPESKDGDEESRDFATTAQDDEIRDLAGTNDNDQTKDLTSTHKGTDKHNTTDNLSYSGRKDATADKGSNANSETLSYAGRNDITTSTDKHTGSVENVTGYGSKDVEAGRGTVNNTQTGTEGNKGKATEKYNNITDAVNGGATDTTTVGTLDEQSGTITNAGSDNYEETFHSEGSTPLRTYQALIQEEIEGRSGLSWNFTDIVIRDVQLAIASKIWRRNRV